MGSGWMPRLPKPAGRVSFWWTTIRGRELWKITRLPARSSQVCSRNRRMKDGSQSRRKKLEKISFEEVMGAAGMSGFGALLERRPGIEEPAWQPVAESRLKFLIKGAALAEKLGRQNDMLSSLKEPLTRRVTSLAQALGILKHRLSAND